MTIVGQTLSLTGAIKANYYFGFSGSVAKAEMLVWDGVSGALTEENVTYKKDMISSDRGYTAQSAEYAAREYGKTSFVCAKITDSDGGVHYSETIAYSPETYAAGKANDSDVALAEVVRRLVIYGETARIYFES